MASGRLAVDIDVAKQVKARIKNGSEWSPLIDAKFVLPERFPLRIVELNYNPAESGDETEYIELINTGDEPIELAGVSITEFSSAGYTFTGGSLAAGARMVVVKDQAAFAAAYPGVTTVAPGVFSGSLANEGELVSLRGPLGELLQSFTYGDKNVSGWPVEADGDGRSLEYVGPFDQDAENPGSITGDPYDTSGNWRASLIVGGSPGASGNVTPLAGDYDASGSVDQLDWAKWKADFGMSITPGSGADGNSNGVVDAGDYSVWRDNLGASQPAAGGGAVVVIAESAMSTAVPTSFPFAAWLVAAEPAAGGTRRVW